jgi:predicted DNA-binding transcriptional regulator AlpA
MRNAMQQTLLDIDAVASRLGLSRSTCRRMWYDGTLPKPRRFGRRGIKWLSEEIEEFIRNRPTVAHTEKAST